MIVPDKGCLARRIHVESLGAGSESHSVEVSSVGYLCVLSIFYTIQCILFHVPQTAIIKFAPRRTSLLITKGRNSSVGHGGAGLVVVLIHAKGDHFITPDGWRLREALAVAVRHETCSPRLRRRLLLPSEGTGHGALHKRSRQCSTMR